jgi:hypothetical protein
LEGYKSPGIDQILSELIKTIGKTLHLEIQKLVNSAWNKEVLYSILIEFGIPMKLINMCVNETYMFS